MIEMLHRQNFPALFLTRDSPVSLPDGSGGQIRMIRNWHRCLALILLYCVVLHTYRHCDELITHSRSPTVCRKTDYEAIMTVARAHRGCRATDDDDDDDNNDDQ
jgi:hypothetical protein